MKRNVCRAAIFLLLAAAMCLTHVHAAADFQELEDVTLDPNALYNGIVLPEDYTSARLNIKIRKTLDKTKSKD